jgi:hypothetical protein
LIILCNRWQIKARHVNRSGASKSTRESAESSVRCVSGNIAAKLNFFKLMLQGFD